MCSHRMGRSKIALLGGPHDMLVKSLDYIAKMAFTEGLQSSANIAGSVDFHKTPQTNSFSARVIAQASITIETASKT